VAVHTAGAVLSGQGQGPLEDLQITHQPGAALAIEVAAVELSDMNWTSQRRWASVGGRRVRDHSGGRRGR
jgi:hypothetical protein